MKSLKAILFVCSILMLFMSSCIPYKKFVVFQPNEQYDTLPKTIAPIHPPVIASNDILDIFVTSTSEEASKYFNYSENMSENSMLSAFLVDQRGEVQIPIVGNVKVAGLTTEVARDTITKRLSKYLVSPAVKLSIRNFRITVLGEVLRPGVYSVVNEKSTITEVLAMAGDITVFGMKERVEIIRDSSGYKSYQFVNLNSREIFSSPYYNLKANDIVYVQPYRQKRFQTENYYRVLPLVLSTATIVLGLLQLSR